MTAIRLALVALTLGLLPLQATPPNRPGPNAPKGLEKAWPGYDGSVLPAASIKGDTRNAFGSASFGSQASGLTLEKDPDNPTGSGTNLKLPYPGVHNPDWPAAFQPGDFGGQAPVRFGMQMDLDRDHAWRELYLRVMYRVSPNFSSYGRSVSGKVMAEGKSTGGTMNKVTDDAARWRRDEHAGRFVKVAGVTRRIATNTSTTLTLAGDQRFTYPPNGERYQVYTFTVGDRGWNAGTKFFFPRLTCRFEGRGAAASGAAGDNNFVNLWAHFDGTMEGLTPQLGIQLNRIWDGRARDSKGRPSWGNKFGMAPAARRPLAVKKGEWIDAEYYFKVNTPGRADGVYTVWNDGVRVYHETDVTYAPKWVPAGEPWGEDAVECHDPRWAYVWLDPTFGGGSNIPERDQDVRIRGWYIGGR